MTEQQITDLLHETQRQRFGAQMQISQASNGKSIESDVENLHRRVDYLQSVEAALDDYLVNADALGTLEDKVIEHLDTIHKLEQRIKELEGEQ